MERLERSQTKQPTEPGWYFARYRRSEDKSIGPVLVDYVGDGTKTMCPLHWHGEKSSFERFEWFGPVPEVQPL